MAELEHVVKTFSLLETAEKEQPFLTREQKQDLYRIAFHKESMEEVEKIILQLQAPHAGKEEKERILYHYLEPFFQVPEVLRTLPHRSQKPVLPLSFHLPFPHPDQT